MQSAADYAQILRSLESRVFEVLPDETWVYPGHGDDTTLGRERPQLGQWRERGWGGDCPAGGAHDTAPAADGVLTCRKCDGRFG